MDLQTLAARLRPRQTVLFLGAGASVSSGAPSGAVLARKLASEVGQPDDISLEEAAGIFEAELGRARLIECVRAELETLEPARGLLAAAAYDWRVVYTTNYDALVEKAYAKSHRPLAVVRSNYDVGRNGGEAATTLYKVHGCISEDRSLGHRASMVITEEDWENARAHRESLFDTLVAALATNDVLIVGHSMSDPRLRQMVKDLGRRKREQGGHTSVYVLVYAGTEQQLGLLEKTLGVVTAKGGIDELFDAVGNASVSELNGHEVAASDGAHVLLRRELLAASIEAEHAAKLPPSPVEMFAGRPATFADVAAGNTFERNCEQRVRAAIERGAPCVVITGVAGSGKTTAARRIGMSVLGAKGAHVWEHVPSSFLNVDAWVGMAKTLAGTGRRAILIVDDCASYLGKLNELVEVLVAQGLVSLQLIATAETSQWAPRRKSPRFFSHGEIVELEGLQDAEIRGLVRLLEQRPELLSLTPRDFRDLSSAEKRRRIVERSSADMFVALRYLSDSESVDTIVLAESARLDETARQLYETVSLLQSAGARVHRQLVLRVLGIESYQIAFLLEVLSGLLFEKEVDTRLGIYGWQVRHDVIAGIIADARFHDEERRFDVLDRTIDALSPTIFLEGESVGAMCNADGGIKKLEKRESRIALYRKLIGKAPQNRVPRHRYVSELLGAGELAGAEAAIRDAVAEVGSDRPLARYSAILQLRRAQRAEGVLEGDRVHMGARALQICWDMVRDYGSDMYAYMTLMEVALGVFDLSPAKGGEAVRKAYEVVSQVVPKILDPKLERAFGRFQRDCQRRNIVIRDLAGS